MVKAATICQLLQTLSCFIRRLYKHTFSKLFYPYVYNENV